MRDEFDIDADQERFWIMQNRIANFIEFIKLDGHYSCDLCENISEDLLKIRYELQDFYDAERSRLKSEE